MLEMSCPGNHQREGWQAGQLPTTCRLAGRGSLLEEEPGRKLGKQTADPSPPVQPQEKGAAVLGTLQRDITPVSPDSLLSMGPVQPSLLHRGPNLTTQLNGPGHPPRQGCSLPSEHAHPPQLCEDTDMSVLEAPVLKSVLASSKHPRYLSHERTCPRFITEEAVAHGN